MKKYGFLTAILALVVCASIVSPSWATMVTAISAGTETVMFSDDYEDGFTADVGSWDVTAGNEIISPTSGPITAYQGDSFLRATRGAVYPIASANFIALPSLITGDTVHLETMVAYNSTTENSLNGLVTRLSNGTADPIFLSIFGETGQLNARIYHPSQVTYTPVLDSNDHEVFLTQNTWYKLGIDYTIGESTYSVSLDDTLLSSSLGLFTSSAPSSIDHLEFNGNRDGNFYLDAVAVPEPSSIALILCGIGTLLFVRRR